MLSEQQRAFFEIFGYLRLPGLMADVIGEIDAAFTATFAEYPGEIVEWVHETHENRMRRFISGVTGKNDFLDALTREPRIAGLASALLGEDYVFRGSDCSIYDCGTLFHKDAYGANLAYTNIKMALYLEPIDEHSGAIRVIPGSHHRGDKFVRQLNPHVESGFRDLGLSTGQVPSTVLPSEPGDLLLWNYRLIHATQYGGNQRRMLALEFSENY
ncbi:phytanoyl-CoA dioxygenase family protein [Parahaliea maris]|nr:phytanoyl-CoA dioxygenase family protein [Parahaliea maris]